MCHTKPTSHHYKPAQIPKAFKSTGGAKYVALSTLKKEQDTNDDDDVVVVAVVIITITITIQLDTTCWISPWV